MINSNYKPWPYFNVKVSVTSNPKKNETIKVQAKNESMAGFLALRESSVCKEGGCGQVNNIQKVAS